MVNAQGNQDRQARRERLIALAVIIACISSFGLMGGLNSTLISLVLKSRGVSETLIGLNTTAFAVGILVFSPIVPRLTSLFSAKYLLLAALLVEVLAILLLPAFSQLPVWFFSRFLMGAVAMVMYSISEAWLNQIADDSNRGRVMSVYIIFLSLGFAVGHSVVALTGIEGWLPFLVAVGIASAAGLPMLFAGTVRLGAGHKPAFGIIRFFFIAPTIAGAVALFAFLEMTVAGLLPVYVVGNGYSAQAASFAASAVALGGMLLQYPIGWLGDKFNRTHILIFCVLCGGFGAFFLPWAMGAGWLIWPHLLLWGGLYSGAYTLALAITGERFKGSELVMAGAALGALWGVGSIFGPALGGFVMETFGNDGFPNFLAASCLLYAVFAVFRLWQKKTT